MGRPFLLLQILVVGCGSGEPRGSSAAPVQRTGGDERSSSAEAPDLAHHMNRSFWAAIQARDALIDGNLELAKRRAGSLADERFDELPAEWKPWLGAMQKAASDVAVSADMPEAARRLASLAVSCGRCHDHGDRGPRQTDLPQDGAEDWRDEDLTERMLRHQWASDELWFALITPSDLQWQRGARALSKTFFTTLTDREGRELPRDVQARLEEIRQLGERAGHAGSPEARAEVYGELLARCATCHYETARAME